MKEIVKQARKIRVLAAVFAACACLAGTRLWASEYIQKSDVDGEVHASTLLPLNDGSYLAAWFGGTKEQAPDVAIWGSRRVNGKWETPRVLAKVKDEAHWNPVLRRADDGRISLYFKVGTNCEHWVTYLIESRDEGETWDEPRELVKGDVSGGRGPVRNKCLRLDFPSRRWLAPASCEIDGWRAFIDRSGDDGLTWTKSPIPMPEPENKNKGVIQPTLWLSTNGIVRAYMRSNTGYIWETKSTDNGITWETARQTKIPNTYSSGIDIVKASDGFLYLVLNTWPSGYVRRSVLEIWRSADDGANWSPWKVLESENGCEFSYPCIIEPKPGTLAVTYTWKRKRIAFAEFSRDPMRVYVTISSASDGQCLAPREDCVDAKLRSPEPTTGTGVAKNAVVKKGSTVGTEWKITTKEGLHEGYAVYLVYGKSYVEVTNMVHAQGSAMSYSAFTKWATRLDEGNIKQLMYGYNINGDGKKALQLISTADFNDASKPVAVFTYIQDDWLVPQYNVIAFDTYKKDSEGNSYPHYNGTLKAGEKCTGWANFGSTYAVTLNGNGGKFTDLRGYYYSDSGSTKLPTTVTKAGLTFDSWYADAAFAGSPVAAIGPKERGDKTFWAKWVKSASTTDDAGAAVTVKVPEAWTTEKGVTDITASGANGIPYWKSYVLGLNPKDASSKTVLAPVQTSDATKLTLGLGDLVPKTDAGVKVTYTLDTKDATGAWQSGSEQTTHQFNFPLSDVSGVKYFRIQSHLYKQ